jgi:adenosylhomocysteine nucleosidase
MIALVFATVQEARPFLMAAQAQIIHPEPFAVYRSDLRSDLRVVVSGMGKVAAAAAAQAMILTGDVARLINAGACGALRDTRELAIGNLVRISEAVEGDHDIFGKRLKPVPCSAEEFLDLPAMRLVTSDRPVFDTTIRAAFSQFGDVVDMEGAAVARIARYYRLPCTLIKGISDNAQPLDRRTLLENLTMVSEQIAQKLWHALKER